MTLHVNLRVHDVTATLRGDDPTRPVIAGTDGTRVVLLAEPAEAEVLAKLIARGASVEHPGDDIDQDLVNHTIVDLLAAASQAAGNIAAPCGYTLKAVQ